MQPAAAAFVEEWLRPFESLLDAFDEPAHVLLMARCQPNRGQFPVL